MPSWYEFVAMVRALFGYVPVPIIFIVEKRPDPSLSLDRVPAQRSLEVLALSEVESDGQKSAIQRIPRPHRRAVGSLERLIELGPELASRVGVLSVVLEWPKEIEASGSDEIAFRSGFLPCPGNGCGTHRSQLEPIERILAPRGSAMDRVTVARVVAGTLQAIHDLNLVQGGLPIESVRFQRVDGGLRVVLLFNSLSRPAGWDSPSQPFLGAGLPMDFAGDRAGLVGLLHLLLFSDPGRVDPDVCRLLGGDRCQALQTLDKTVRSGENPDPYPGEWLALLGEG